MRKVAFTSETDFLLVYTDAPRERLEEFCYAYVQYLENGMQGEHPYHQLKTEFTVMELMDSDHEMIEGLKAEGYDEVYAIEHYIRKKKDKIIYWVDMDGTLAKWEDATIEETFKPGYFLHREICVPMARTIKKMITLGHDVRILSSVYNERVVEEKKLWLKKIAALDIKAVFVPYGENKSDHIQAKADEFHVLIDDHTPNLNAWSRIGFGIKFLNGINGNGKNGKKSWNGAIISDRMSPEVMCMTIIGLADQYLNRKDDM